MANSTLDQALERWQAQAAGARRRTQEQIAEARRRWESRVAAQRDGGSGLMEDEAPSDEDERDEESDEPQDDREASAEQGDDEPDTRADDQSESAERSEDKDRDARAQEDDRPEQEGRAGERDEGRKLPGLITKGVPALLALKATKEAASAVARYRRRRRRSAFRSITSGAALGSVAVLLGQTVSNERVRASAARFLRNGVAALRNER